MEKKILDVDWGRGEVNTYFSKYGPSKIFGFSQVCLTYTSSLLGEAGEFTSNEEKLVDNEVSLKYAFLQGCGVGVGIRVGVAGVVGFWKAGVGVGSRGFLKRPESESESKFTYPETTPRQSLILFEIQRLVLLDF